MDPVRVIFIVDAVVLRRCLDVVDALVGKYPLAGVTYRPVLTWVTVKKGGVDSRGLP